MILQNLGVEELNQGRIPEAAANFQEGLELMAEVLAAIRDEPGYSELDEDQQDTRTASRQISHDKAAVALAYVNLRLGRTEESLALYEKAISGRREIFERRPAMPIFKRELAGYLGNFGNSLLWIDRPEEAAPALHESVTLFEELHAADPVNVYDKRQLALSLARMGTLRDVQGNPKAASPFFRRSRALYRDLFTASPDEKNKVNLMLAEARAGNSEAARRLSDELGAGRTINGELHLDRARALALLSKDVVGDPRNGLRDAALTALERAVTEGYSDPFLVRHERELDPLHDTARFRDLVSEGKVDLTKVKVIWTTPAYVDYTWTARAALPEATRAGFAQTFLDLDIGNPKHQPILERLGAKKYVPASPSDFDAIESIARATGMLE